MARRRQDGTQQGRYAFAAVKAAPAAPLVRRPRPGSASPCFRGRWTRTRSAPVQPRPAPSLGYRRWPMYQSRHVISSGGASSAPDCVALQGRPVKGSFAVADAMAHAPPSTVPPFQAVSGSYRMRHLYASAR
jgi:hypothetical protein